MTSGLPRPTDIVRPAQLVGFVPIAVDARPRPGVEECVGVQSDLSYKVRHERFACHGA